MPAKLSEPRPLNQKQLTILHTLYRFRFATTQLLAQTLHIQQSKVHPRLTLLLDQDYIGRKDEVGFRLPGQYAIYYLMPRGVNALTDLPSDPRVASLKRRLDVDEGRSERFINHCLIIFDIQCQLSAQYGARLRFFTKSDLAPYGKFPRPLPDAYIRLDTGANERQFFLEYMDASMPFFAATRRIQQYADYADDDVWSDATSTPMPQVILICEKSTVQKRLNRYIDSELDDDLSLQVASKGEVTAILETKRKPETR